ncbi:flavin-containing monooxygenase FMO GS-OX-like 9 [Morus notabilis]|uniref:flavin-containing monooxygenase FMO GS-OX-like 9 n=1 Tax=Morus notabilis TaxID=981085 RepID=UPI000CECE41C|nr:flavin-containing monooxygenase FMO GS-OX-like 9 [Morus notabilis]
MVSEHSSSKTVCVIGAGPSGLVAARELRKEGHTVVVLEQSHDVGGQWLYNPNVEGHEPMGPKDMTRFLEVHSSVYASLRLVSPRETMGFTDFPFSIKKGRDSRRFPGHREVYLYLKDFCEWFGLRDCIRFNTRVEYVGMVDYGVVNGKDLKWIVKSREWKRSNLIDDHDHSNKVVEEVFDAVVVATGHYSFPKLPSFKGMGSWKRKQMHSHFYRVPEPFRDEVVVIVGNSLSGQDLSMELVEVAKEVCLSSRSMNITEGLSKVIAKHENLHLRPQIDTLEEDGKVSFLDGSWIIADTIIYCTGYSYTFPFLDTKGIVAVDDCRVGPLYEHTFPPSLAPSLSFIGIPRKIIGFPFFESQAKWVAQVLSGKRTLPSWDDMMRSIKELYHSRDVAGIPKENTHDIADFEYCDRYGDNVGFPHLEEWRKQLCISAITNSLVNLETYRDSYDHDHELLQEAFQSPHFTQQAEPQAIAL